MKLKPFVPLLTQNDVRIRALEPGTENQASREAWWNQMLNDNYVETVWHPQRSTSLNIFQQNRTDVEANVEAVCSGKTEMNSGGCSQTTSV